MWWEHRLFVQDNWDCLQVTFFKDCGIFSRHCCNCNFMEINPTNIFLFKVNNRNSKKRCKIYLKLTIKTPEWRQWRCSGVFVVNFEHISQLFLLFLLLNLNRYMLTGNTPRDSPRQSVFCRGFCRGKQCFYSYNLGKNIAEVIIS